MHRPAAGEDAAGITVQLTDGESATEFVLNVGSRQMTEEEFDTAATSVAERLGEAILGRNTSLDYVTEDLVFPDKDSAGLLEISWDTDALTVISRNGTVRRDELEEPCEVTIKAELSDGIRNRQVDIGPVIAAAIVGASHICGLFIMFPNCSIDVPSPTAKKLPFPLSRMPVTAKPII